MSNIADKQLASLSATHRADGYLETKVPIRYAPSAAHAGGGFVIRNLHAPDAAACEEFFRSLDRDDIRMRFASPRAYSSDLFLRDPGTTTVAAVDPMGAVLGIVNIAPLSSDSAEIAIVIRSDVKRRGIGRSLLARVIERMSCDGFEQLLGYVLAENQPMLALARRMGFQSLRWDSLFVVVSRPSTQCLPHPAKALPQRQFW